MKKKLTTGIVLFAAASVAQGAFVISQPDNNANFGNLATGQTFTPSVGMEVDPGVNTETIDLVAFSLWSHGGSATGPSTGNLNTVYLLIYDAFPSVASFVGSSTNFVDHSPNLALGTQMTWTFNNLTLDYNTTYYAVFASSQTGVLGINDVGIGLQTQNTDPYAGGNGLIDNFNSGGTQDTRFTATFDNPVAAVPEPSAALLGAMGVLGMIRRRRCS